MVTDFAFYKKFMWDIWTQFLPQGIGNLNKSVFKESNAWWVTCCEGGGEVEASNWLVHKKYLIITLKHFYLQEWLASNFSLQYLFWIKYKGNENKGNDHQF